VIFNQLEFLLLFLPAVMAGFVLWPEWRYSWLIAASFLFYGLSGIDHAVVLALGSTWVWWVCRPRTFAGDRGRLALAIAPPLIALLYYKYLRFLLETTGLAANSTVVSFRLFENLVLPAGISFFTFHLVAYALDRYWGRIERPPPLKHFLLFMSFFPHLVAGPILRYSDVARSLTDLTKFRTSANDLARCIGHVTLGLALKVLIADTLGAYIGQLTANLDTLGAAAGCFVIFGYSFQIFFDFYGYSLVAIGLGFLFGFDFPRNFNRPYLSPDIREFWRRWHMTLSFWIRDYLYKPLGGNEHYVRNILIVFAACGLWHGAGWNFVAWGLAHGALVTLYHYTSSFWDRLARPVRIAATFTAVSCLWILFLFNFHDAGRFLSAVVSNGLELGQVSSEMWLALAVAMIVCFGFDVERIAWNVPLGHVIGRNAALGVLFFATLLFLDRSDTFIYFRF
jgi:alginate O-acetyltransferase complex protein AlgI